MKKLWIALLVFLIIGAYMIKNANDYEGVSDKNFISDYAKWILSIGRNVKDVTGYAAQQQWFPQINSTDKNITDKLKGKAYEIINKETDYS